MTAPDPAQAVREAHLKIMEEVFRGTMFAVDRCGGDTTDLEKAMNSYLNALDDQTEQKEEGR